MIKKLLESAVANAENNNGMNADNLYMRSIITDLNQKFGMTIMISSHLLGELQKVATNYGFIKNGTLIREFSSSDIEDNDLETFYFNNILQE